MKRNLRTYKVYDPAGNALLFDSLSELRAFFDLDNEEIGRCANPGVHTVSFGIKVITFKGE